MNTKEAKIDECGCLHAAIGRAKKGEAVDDNARKKNVLLSAPNRRRGANQLLSGYKSQIVFSRRSYRIENERRKVDWSLKPSLKKVSDKMKINLMQTSVERKLEIE